MKTAFIDPDITRAETLPGSYYTDPVIYAEQVATLLPDSWQCLPLALGSYPTAHNLLPFTLLPGSLNEPLLLLQNQAGEDWRCFSNVCTHRGAVLIDKPGQSRRCQTLICPYHGRSFSRQGQMLGMPAFEQAQDFPRRADHLPELPLQSWGPLQFTCLGNPRFAFSDWIAPVRERLDFLPWADFVYRADLSRDYVLDANWMLYCDNYLEGLHIPYVHPALNQALNFKAYQTLPLAAGVLQIGIAAKNEACFDLPTSHPDFGQKIAAWYFWLFPNLMLNIYPWGLSLNIVEPLSLTQTRIRYLTWVWQEDRLEQGAGADTNSTEHEDHAVVQRVQTGVQSRLYTRGRYSPTMEQGLHRFHRLLTTVSLEPPMV